MAFDLQKAVRANQRYSRELGWEQHWGRISREFHSAVMSGEDLAEAMAQWQYQHTPRLSSDGILGPKTWRWMSQAIAPIYAAVTANRRLKQELGWERHYAELAEFFGIRSSSESAERQFALAVFRWQTEEGLLADGIIGRETLNHPRIVELIGEAPAAGDAQLPQNPGRAITIEQFVAILFQIRTRYRNTPYNWDNPEVLYVLMVEEYNVDRLLLPLGTFEGICRECLPPEWTYQRIRGEPDRISNVSPGAASEMDRRVRESRQWEPGPLWRWDEIRHEWVRVFDEDILGDLDLLSSSWIGALTFIVGIAIGLDRRDSMRWARFADAVSSLFVMNGPYVKAHSRALSSTSASPRNSSRSAGIRLMEQEIISQQRGANTSRDQRSASQRRIPPIPDSLRPAPGSRRPLPPPISKAQTRQQLRERFSRQQTQVRSTTTRPGIRRRR